MPDNPIQSPDARAQVIAGLRQLADYLDQNPGVPVAKYGWQLAKFAMHDDDADGKAQVDRVADLLGVDVDDRTADGGHYIAAKSFGPVRYEMICVTQQRKAERDALNSYAGAIQPDTNAIAA